MRATLWFCLALLPVPATSLAASPDAPWGQARSIDQTYAKQKVVYDVAVASEAAMRSVISRAQLLAGLNGSDPFDTKVVIVLHGNEIPYFAIRNFFEYQDLMRRAQSATQSGIVEFRMCHLAAEGFGLKSEDIQGFVTMVPMADAEIVRLQQEGYAYMR
jgi:intracellular sulfur oxidation DsrE/DsrF family protein